MVVSVNVAAASPMLIDGKQVLTAINKRPVSTPDNPARVAVKTLGMAGDEAADPTVHGGIAKAVYAYPQGHFSFWQTVRAQAGVAAWDAEMPPGLMGENLTLTGLLEADAWVGDVLRFPDCTLVVSEPRYPCFKFEARMFKQASKLMAQSGFCGFYLAVRHEGSIAAGDTYTIEAGAREVSIRELFMAKMRKTSAAP
jgi:MOSC domain-containing protein YiiM